MEVVIKSKVSNAQNNVELKSMPQWMWSFVCKRISFDKKWSQKKVNA